MTLQATHSESGSTSVPLSILVLGWSPAVLACLDAAGHAAAQGRLDTLATEAALHDLIILEVRPGGGELRALARARASGLRTPAIALLDGEVEERVRGLEAGADDCLSRPVVPAELRARIRAVARRCPRLVATPVEGSPSRAAS